MIYKRATRALQEAGINHIVIVKRLLGSAPEDTNAIVQRSRCFKTWQEARDAVLNGYRPEVIRSRPTLVEADLPFQWQCQWCGAKLWSNENERCLCNGQPA